ncbi:hypothetical protein D9758_000261 [Tetrapyrgos nigripes]|uniref:Uncharacterized protein n=1 Tax=Tetrapyrgos nigripes TaxID=182062 RepID=A0A8H5H1U0_9AGAR|nr:hypothetical protein D9758_000261 [Tetrapyrgos nigripes]
MDFVQSLDPSKARLGWSVLVIPSQWILGSSGSLLQVLDSFLLLMHTSIKYNFPLYLFGFYAQENSEAVQSLQTFTGLLGVSMLYDIIWMIKYEQSGFIKFLTIVLLLLKVPTFLAFGLAARQRGAQFGGLGIRGSDLSGPTVWSMPGGFTSSGREGYQTVDEEPPLPPPPTQHSRPAAPPPPSGPQAPGAYQSV